MADNLDRTLSARCFFSDKKQDQSSSSDAPKHDGTKRRGRPRMVPIGDTLRMDSRAQIRYAQRTYRHKKEVMLRNLNNRVTELEGSMSRVSASLSVFYDMAIESDLHLTHPRLFRYFRDTL